MTQTPTPVPEKRSLWTLVAESDLSKAIAPILWTLGVAAGMAWWVISRDKDTSVSSSLSAYQITIMNTRMDKMEGKQDAQGTEQARQAIILNTLVNGQASGKEKLDAQGVKLDNQGQVLAELTRIAQTIQDDLRSSRSKGK